MPGTTQTLKLRAANPPETGPQDGCPHLTDRGHETHDFTLLNETRTVDICFPQFTLGTH